MGVRFRALVANVAAAQVDDQEARTVTLRGVNKCSGPNADEEDEDSIYGKYTPHFELQTTILGDAGRWFQDRLGEKVELTASDPEE